MKPILEFELNRKYNPELKKYEIKVNKESVKYSNMRQLTEKQKRHNREEAVNKLISIILEKITTDGGIHNVKQSNNT